MATRTMTPQEEPSRRPDQRRDSALPEPEGPSPWRATGQEAPVFYDERGRRGLFVRMLGVIGAFGSAATLTLIVIGALAFVHVAPLSRGVHSVLPVQAVARHQPAVDGAAAALRSPTRLASRDARADLATFERHELRGGRERT